MVKLTAGDIGLVVSNICARYNGSNAIALLCCISAKSPSRHQYKYYQY
ncbi:MAG TPA: hypothetical protein PLL09_00625 [Flavobacterium sp.]|nr:MULTISPECIES: hypothetical protein [unclassified Flavobacterium]HRE76304.1 hypothetical protein [Flavobacterium sp.]